MCIYSTYLIYPYKDFIVSYDPISWKQKSIYSINVRIMIQNFCSFLSQWRYPEVFPTANFPTQFFRRRFFRHNFSDGKFSDNYIFRQLHFPTVKFSDGQIFRQTHLPTDKFSKKFIHTSSSNIDTCNALYLSCKHFNL